MTFSRKEARARLISKAGEIFRDVITGQSVSQEVDLSAVLALKHNWGMVDWKKVNLHQVNGEGMFKEVPAASFGFENLVASANIHFFRFRVRQGSKHGVVSELIFFSLADPKIRCSMWRTKSGTPSKCITLREFWNFLIYKLNLIDRRSSYSLAVNLSNKNGT